MKEVIERCNWLVNKCNDKAITPDVKEDFRYLLEEIERQKEIIRQLDIKNLELTTILKEVREYIEKNTQWYDKELGLVEMEGYNSNRIPVVYLYGLLEILDKVSNNE